MVTGPSYAPLLFVFDGDPATPRKKGTPTPTQFLAHVYCGHGRRSQLLLSSCCSSADEFLVMLIAEYICERWLGLCRYADVDIGLVTLVGMAISVAHGLHIRADVPQYIYLYS